MIKLMLMKKAFKYRIYPNKSQISALENTFSMCRHLYNWSFMERKEAWEQEQRTVTYQEQQNALPALKEERPWFKEVYSQVLQDVLKRLDLAYEKFFREKRGYPKLRKKGQWTSICYPQYRYSPQKGHIYVPKIGTVKIKLHRPLPQGARIKTLSIMKEGTKWFASFSVEYDVSLKPPIELKQLANLESLKAIGLDLGLIDYYYASDGTHVEVPKYFRKLEKRLRKLQRKQPKWRSIH